jgi:hypothetical protein
MHIANDNNDSCYMLFFDSEDDNALATHVEGPFPSFNAAVDYGITAFNWAKENGVAWVATEIVSASDFEPA